MSTAVDEVNTFKFPEDDADSFHKLPTLLTLLVPPEMIMDNDTKNPVNNKEAAKIEEAIPGSTTVDNLHCSTCISIPPRITKVSFKNKLYSNGTYKNSTIHITVNAGHNNDHPSPINQDPYMHLLGIVMLHYSDPNVLGAAFVQSYSFKAGLKKFGKIGEKAAIAKLVQLHDYTTYHPVHAQSLSLKECQKALSSLMNIIEKQDGRVCIHACVDSSIERLEPGYKKEDGASPTVATDCILISATIDAHKGCDVATINIPGAFLNAYNNKETIMLLKGRLAKLMVQIEPQLYCKYIIHNSKNQPLPYVKLTKIITALLKSALLFYQKFVKDLKLYSLPFIINLCDPCVANATILGSPMTVTWHVDDLKTLHIDPFQVTKFAAYLATIYGNGLVIHHGPIQDYLGMDLNFSQPGIEQISMINYTKKVLKDFPKAVTTSCATPVANNLFTV